MTGASGLGTGAKGSVAPVLASESASWLPGSPVRSRDPRKFRATQKRGSWKGPKYPRRTWVGETPKLWTNWESVRKRADWKWHFFRWEFRRLIVVVQLLAPLLSGGPKWRVNFPEWFDHPVTSNRLEKIRLQCLQRKILLKPGLIQTAIRVRGFYKDAAQNAKKLPISFVCKMFVLPQLPFFFRSAHPNFWKSRFFASKKFEYL